MPSDALSEEVGRLYRCLGHCVGANDREGVRRICRELLQAKRPLSEIMTEIALLNHNATDLLGEEAGNYLLATRREGDGAAAQVASAESAASRHERIARLMAPWRMLAYKTFPEPAISLMRNLRKRASRWWRCFWMPPAHSSLTPGGIPYADSVSPDFALDGATRSYRVESAAGRACAAYQGQLGSRGSLALPRPPSAD